MGPFFRTHEFKDHKILIEAVHNSKPTDEQMNDADWLIVFKVDIEVTKDIGSRASMMFGIFPYKFACSIIENLPSEIFEEFIETSIYVIGIKKLMHDLVEKKLPKQVLSRYEEICNKKNIEFREKMKKTILDMAENGSINPNDLSLDDDE